jgi:phosphoribosylformylglycinamidine cyclo-ligase
MQIHAMAHITGGGIPENLPRCLSPGQAVAIHPDTWQIPPIFTWLAEVGKVQPKDMFNTFNMGIGFVVIVPASELESSLAFFQQQGIAAGAIGTVIADPAGVIMPWLL